MNKDKCKWLLVSISGKPCALDLTFVRELLARPILVEPPGMPSILDGYFDLGGTAVVVISIEHLFDLPKYELDIYSPLVLIKHEPFPLGIQTHRVSGVVSLDSSSIRPVNMEESFNHLITGFAQINNQMTSLISIERILAEKETLIFQEFSKLIQARLDLTREVRT